MSPCPWSSWLWQGCASSGGSWVTIPAESRGRAVHGPAAPAQPGLGQGKERLGSGGCPGPKKRQQCPGNARIYQPGTELSPAEVMHEPANSHREFPLQTPAPESEDAVLHWDLFLAHPGVCELGTWRTEMFCARSCAGFVGLGDPPRLLQQLLLTLHARGAFPYIPSSFPTSRSLISILHPKKG